MSEFEGASDIGRTFEGASDIGRMPEELESETTGAGADVAAAAGDCGAGAVKDGAEEVPPAAGDGGVEAPPATGGGGVVEGSPAAAGGGGVANGARGGIRVTGTDEDCAKEESVGALAAGWDGAASVVTDEWSWAWSAIARPSEARAVINVARGGATPSDRERASAVSAMPSRPFDTTFPTPAFNAVGETPGTKDETGLRASRTRLEGRKPCRFLEFSRMAVLHLQSGWESGV